MSTVTEISGAHASLDCNQFVIADYTALTNFECSQIAHLLTFEISCKISTSRIHVKKSFKSKHETYVLLNN